MTDLRKLLPCPFCGDPMEIYNEDLIRHIDQGSCPVGAMGFTIDRADAWNTRDPDLAAALLVAQKALAGLLAAVCGETGLVSCIRADSGKAYPWPALDDAEVQARAALAEIERIMQ